MEPGALAEESTSWETLQNMSMYQESAPPPPSQPTLEHMAPFAPQPPPPQMAAAVHPPPGTHIVQPLSGVPSAQAQHGHAHAHTRPVDWQQLQLQMQALYQQNPVVYQQMQHFFWLQSLSLQQQQSHQQAQAQAQAQAPPMAGFMNGPFANVGEYNLVSIPVQQHVLAPGQKSGPGMEYMSGAAEGLFIPPMVHVPHAEEGGRASSPPTQRNRSQAIPIVPPKVRMYVCMYVCRYVCICIYICTYVHTFIYINYIQHHRLRAELFAGFR